MPTWAMMAGLLCVSAAAHGEELLFPSMFAPQEGSAYRSGYPAPPVPTMIPSHSAPLALPGTAPGAMPQSFSAQPISAQSFSAQPISAQPGTPSSFSAALAAPCDTCPGMACATPASRCRSWGVIGGAELIVFQAYHAEGDYTSFVFQPGVRFWAGLQGPDGLGFVFRYFDYDQTSNAQRFASRLYDWEVYDSQCFGGKWNLQFGAGVRYGEVFDSGIAAQFTGVGPVGSALLTRPVFSDLSLYASGRASALYGTVANGLGNDFVMQILELGAGLQWNRRLHRGANIFVRSGWEGQVYYGYVDGDSEGAGLGGFTLSAGLLR